ncbi:hypothetical protein [Chryseobacterium sp. PMSZPI]|uniref:hypothetical protein n=1 Tax=Chryseobacterium sp. PMSZPI TaxID=1033900 RepID=UPI000C3248C1|nr:hypothetical protein [Chryseobacterium sp. PMSZPI]PKF74494.1 hypothetical protein CW752_09020 [Chryseobacterium sp. PMSZPI]
MKKIIMLSGVLFSGLAFSQIGVNTPNPQGTFHVDGAKDNASTGVPTIAQQANDFVVLNNGNVGVGTVAPTNKLDIRSTTNGALKIVDGTQGANKILTSDENGVATWKDFPAPVAPADTNIYNSNGTLTGDRIVTQATRRLAFEGNSTNAFAINRTGANPAPVLSVDTQNVRIGIGTNNPTNLLDIRSTTNGALKIVDGTQGNARVLTSDAAGVATWKDLPASVDTSIYNTNGTLTGARTVAQGTNSLAFTSTATTGTNHFSVDGSTFSVDAVNNRVGLGTTAPTNVLDIRSTTNGALKIADGTQGNARVLTSDANGVATWKDLPASVDTSIYNTNGTLTGARTVAQGTNSLAFTSTATTGTNHFSVDGSTFSVDAVTNRVGIGTTTPKNMLDLGSGNGKKLALWNSAAGDDFYGLGNAANVLQLFAGATEAGNPLMTLNKNGRVGIGTTAPTNVLDVRSTTNGAVKIVDGTQGANKILTSDANGVATWQRAASNVTVGTLGSGYDVPFTKFSDFRYTGSTITLPPGKWMVTISLLVYPGGNLTVDDWIFVRSTFSDANLTTIGQTGVQSNDVVRPTLMSFQLAGPYKGGQNKYNVATGSVQINNTSGADKTYRYVVGATEVSGTVTGAKISQVGGSWSENAIYAIAVN